MGHLQRPSNDDLHPLLCLRFLRRSGNYGIEKCTHKQQARAFRKLREFCCHTWKDVASSDGLKLKKAGLKALGMSKPRDFEPDITAVQYIRVSDKFRVYGSHQARVFHVFWLDPDHKARR